ncbi:MAG: methyltransferase domain-containing protein [Patescibacteria group bacterium]|nr:methyltransferase domain-containing protein [Patescibacteria group bacterium]
MKTYISTFITGTQEIVGELLKKRRVTVKLLLDGLVVYESDYPEREIRNFRFLNNTFIPVRIFSDLKPDKKSVERILSTVINDKNTRGKVAANLPARRKNFKIVTSLENQTIAIDRDLLEKLEAILSQAGNLRLNIKKPDLEFWTLVRREGFGFFGIRITYPYIKEDQREKGELRSEIAYIMSALSEPTPKDTVLDPFAGHGAIPLERARGFPFRKIIAVEKDRRLVFFLKKEMGRDKKKIDAEQGDAFNLKIKSGAVDKIITDPPWGIYEETDIPLDEFYKKMLSEFLRVLKPGGILILLIGQINVFEKVVVELGSLQIDKRYPILVSGRKATIYKARKSRNEKD